jgi:hypothetical protein
LLLPLLLLLLLSMFRDVDRNEATLDEEKSEVEVAAQVGEEKEG